MEDKKIQVVDAEVVDEVEDEEAMEVKEKKFNFKKVAMIVGGVAAGAGALAVAAVKIFGHKKDDGYSELSGPTAVDDSETAPVADDQDFAEVQ